MRRMVTPFALLAIALTGSAFAQSAPTQDAQLYESNCAECHGQIGSGTPLDLKKLGPDDKGRYLNIMRDGKGQMPAFAGTLDDAQIEKLWAYILSKAK
jgi:mono/diheme cytochrome c family protein